MPEGGCCRCCTGFIFTLGLTALFLWLSLRPDKPTLSIEEFYIPALNKTLNDTSNTTISFDFKLRNNNKDKGVYYDDLNLTFYYTHNLGLPVANFTIPGFRQGFKKSAHRIQTVPTVGLPWDEARREVSNGTGAVFRVDLKTRVRYRIIGVKTKRHTIKIGANLTVKDMGALVKHKDKGVKLSYAPIQ
ncbi:Ndr1-like, partial [Thalictrum thalictroides]